MTTSFLDSLPHCIRGMSKPTLLGNRAAFIILDEWDHSEPWNVERPLAAPQHVPGWKHPIPSTQEHCSSAPSAATRAKLRAKRKKKK